MNEKRNTLDKLSESVPVAKNFVVLAVVTAIFSLISFVVVSLGTSSAWAAANASHNVSTYTSNASYNVSTNASNNASVSSNTSVNSSTSSSSASSISASDSKIVNVRKVPITVQGDSLTVGMKGAFIPMFDNVVSWSALSGRRLTQGQDILRRQRLGDVVVFALGTNDYTASGTWMKDQLKETRRIIGKRRCLIVLTIYAYKDRPALNKAIEDELGRQVKRGQKAVVVDWSKAVRTRRVKLSDGVHPANNRSNVVRAEMVREGVKRCQRM